MVDEPALDPGRNRFGGAASGGEVSGQGIATRSRDQGPWRPGLAVAESSWMPNGAVRVLIADDSERVRAAVRALLEAVGGFEIVGVAVDGAEAVALADDLRPDVVLMDVAMPVLNGIEATRRITAAKTAARVVILTALRGREREAREAGAAAQLLKDTSPAELVRCLRGTSGSPPS